MAQGLMPDYTIVISQSYKNCKNKKTQEIVDEKTTYMIIATLAMILGILLALHESVS